jgi:hypothetical protein
LKTHMCLRLSLQGFGKVALLPSSGLGLVTGFCLGDFKGELRGKVDFGGAFTAFLGDLLLAGDAELSSESL